MAVGNNNFLNNKSGFKEKIDKHKVWLILAIAVAAVIILSLFLYSPIKGALFGKAISASGSEVIRFLGNPNPNAGDTITVFLEVLLNPADTGYTLTDAYPAGWTVSTTDSACDSTSFPGIIHCDGTTSAVHTYNLTIPSTATGEYSFTGLYSVSSEPTTNYSISEATSLTVSATLPTTETICNDNQDNDDDGMIDCWDWDDCKGELGPGGVTCCATVNDCSAGETCLFGVCGIEEMPNELTCDDGVNNDGDEFIDCEDPDCSGDSACATSTENCTNGIDDDGDGDIDCADSDCNGVIGPTGKYCCINNLFCQALSDDIDAPSYTCTNNECVENTTSVVGDTDGNGCVEIGELITYIGQWKSNNASLTNLMAAITNWKSPAGGCS